MKIIAKRLNETISTELKEKEFELNTINDFKKKLKVYRENLVNLEDSSEEDIKEKFLDFFKNVYGYKTGLNKENVDAVLCDKNNSIKTLIEVKSLKNQAEMVNNKDLNFKAFHEILLYYYRLRANNTLSVRTLLITNGKMVYVIDKNIFSKLIEIKEIKNILKDDKNNNTKDIYTALKEALNSIDVEVPTTIVDLSDDGVDEELLYRLFSEYGLFKKEVENDANTLNLDFYNELIYIMGLKENSKAQLVSNGVKNSLLGLTMDIVKNKQSGDPFEMALSLVILWINRILFLKLLEAQLKDTRDDENFIILNPDPENVGKSASLHNLFFNVLNMPRDERDEENKNSYKYVPYFNSSLFNVSSIEEKFDISSIRDTLKIKILSTSKLRKDTDFKELPTWEYLFRFLGCYQFNREKKVSDKNTIIKSSVLGLVFEKLNGHADGAIFTPASITMSMCREIIQRQVVKAFSKKFNTTFKDFETLKYSPSFYEGANREIASEIIDSITLIDPSVGSGHFLVSSMNELIFIKSQLRLLHISSRVDIKNDELVITYVDGSDFKYGINKDGIIPARDNEIQKNIFETKKHIIEKQLYGIDINPNSVNICRLRLWIELLKSSYFTTDELIDMQVLPNLEFKVISANSLVNLFDNNFYNEEYQEAFRNEMSKYYNATLDDRDDIKTKIIDIIDDVKIKLGKKELENYNPFNTHISVPFFDSSFMFGVENFDICIGNPPYVYNKAIDKDIMVKYESQYGFRNDLYTYFYYRAFDLIKDDGIMGYITSNTFTTTETKKKLREFLQSKRLVKMKFVPNVFETVAVEPVVVIAEVNDKKDNYDFTYIDNRFSDIDDNDNTFSVDIETFKNAPNKVFFTPNLFNMMIKGKFLDSINLLLNQYWGSITTSKTIETNKGFLETYRNSLKAGDITLMGLVTDGGVGLQTANNGRFLGAIDGSDEAKRIKEQRLEKIKKFNNEFKTNYNIDSATESEIRELFAKLKIEHGRDIFGQGFVYMIVSQNEIADVSKLTDDEKKNGIAGSKTFVPYDKGDKDGNRWYMPTRNYIDWSKENVAFLSSDESCRWQGYNFYFKRGVAWNLINGDKNTNNLKARLVDNNVYDVGSMKLTSIYDKCSDKYLCCIINSDFINRFTEAFVNYTINFQINDARQIPIVIPSTKQLKTAEDMFDKAKAIKDKEIANAITNEQAEIELDKIQKEVDLFVEKLYLGE